MKYFTMLIGFLLIATASFAAVELSSYQATPGSDNILLQWTTASETNNDHFEILRDGTLVGRVQGAGNSSSPRDYSWTDTTMTRNRSHSYELDAVDGNGTHDSLGTQTAFVGTLGLANFSAVWYGTAVAITWTTQGEANLDHFDLFRGTTFVANAAAHNGTNRRAYARFDSTAVPGTPYTYFLWVVTLSGDSIELDSVYLSSQAVSEPRVIAPESFNLSAYPNPFNPITSLTFDLPRAANSRLSIFDQSGRVVRTLYSGWLTAGEHRFQFVASELPSGTYYAQLKSSVHTATTKLILLK